MHKWEFRVLQILIKTNNCPSLARGVECEKCPIYKDCFYNYTMKIKTDVSTLAKKKIRDML